METKLQTIEERIADMLKENTGRHMLDSGGAYGRNWERNQTRDFSKEPPSSIRFNKWYRDDRLVWDMEITISLYHWLVDRLRVTEESEAWNDKLRAIAEESEESHFHDADEFIETYKEEWDDPYCGGDWVNSYNTESDLSQVIQFRLFDHENETFCILMVHGGCDVRGGYTAPQVFELKCDPAYMFDFRGGAIWGGTPEHDPNQLDIYGKPVGHIMPHRWYGDGYHFISDDTNEKFDDFEATEDPDEYGKIYIDEEGNGYCPYTGELLTYEPTCC